MPVIITCCGQIMFLVLPRNQNEMRLTSNFKAEWRCLVQFLDNTQLHLHPLKASLLMSFFLAANMYICVMCIYIDEVGYISLFALLVT